ncbi:serine/arginine repetitive matrix protein 1 [Tripterygium wilfordii]|uniref:Serine/arginine repetitive matrix protein 1 n=1 Tax=Tripterygium wilfordii TaxID=458696 RepID=A0A7J7C528_TRIWF|nr:uncharacterized protein LOC119987946 [Tripterygium wilfordii]KAF5728937.1 serine/arginine repetitive matrix protein 1 [Tripterygium wilfordii]
MGCCGSTDRASSSSQKHQSRSESAHESRAPPPSAEEETVKEVLSVTPKPKPTPTPPTTNIPNNPNEEESQECKKNWVEPILLDKVKESRGCKVEQGLQEVSEVSEICSSCLSLSESVSTTITDKRDDEDEVRQRVTRSPSKMASRNGYPGDFGPKRERVVGRSPNRRSENSPAKRNGAIGGGSVRMVHSREVGQLGRGGSRPDPRRRDPGESSGRRTGFGAAAANRSKMSRSPSTRRTNRSPGRVRLDPAVNGGRNVEENSVDGNKRPSSTNSDATANESLENPLVSLECFIFL